MAKTSVSEGKYLTLTVPAGGVISGTPVKIGSLLVIPTVTNATVGAKFVGAAQEIWDIPKVTAEPWTEGMLVYWNSGSSLATSVSAGTMFVGVATANRANPSTTGPVLLGYGGR